MSPVERFWSKVDKGGPGGCWLWTASDNGCGYGTFWFDGRQVYAHVFAYELLVGPIPPGKHLDHVRASGCTSTLCVNAPAHLEPVTPAENNRRGNSPSARASRRTHCPQNHPYSGDNLYVDPRGSRKCRTCRYDRQRAARGGK